MLFTLLRGSIPDSRVLALPVVVYLNVLKYSHGGFFSVLIRLVEKSLRLQCSEEALDDSVVPAVALSAHRGPDFVLRKFLSIVVRSVLAASVTVMNQPGLRSPFLYSHINGVETQTTLK